jgi:hypothetical protein
MHILIDGHLINTDLVLDIRPFSKAEKGLNGIMFVVSEDLTIMAYTESPNECFATICNEILKESKFLIIES